MQGGARNQTHLVAEALGEVEQLHAQMQESERRLGEAQALARAHVEGLANAREEAEHLRAEARNQNTTLEALERKVSKNREFKRDAKAYTGYLEQRLRDAGIDLNDDKDASGGREGDDQRRR